jgi:hypothetical protein
MSSEGADDQLSKVVWSPPASFRRTVPISLTCSLRIRRKEAPLQRLGYDRLSQTECNEGNLANSYPAKLAIVLLVKDTGNAFFEAHGFQPLPCFRGVELVNPLAPVIVLG